MPNNDWYEYTSEEMQHLGKGPGDILGLIMRDCKPEGGNVQSRKAHLPRAQENKLAMPALDKLMSHASHTYRDWQAMHVLHVWQPPPAGLQQTREADAFTNRREAT